MKPCARCASPLEPEALACPACKTLVYEADLERLKAKALALEADGQFHASQSEWRLMLSYLPPNTHQATWIVTHLRHLADVPDKADESAPVTTPSWVRRFGPLAPIAMLLLKGKGLLALFQLKSLLSLGLFAGFYGGTMGWAFGFGFAGLILLHELGHYVDIKRRGLPADMPVFLPGLGAYVRWKAMGVPASARAAISLAGPLAGAVASAGCALMYASNGAPIWATLARTSTSLNVLNLIPVWVLDGGQAFTAIDRAGRATIAAFALMLWVWAGDGTFLLVAGAAGWRVFTKDLPEEPSSAITYYFLAVLGALAALTRVVPMVGLNH